MGIGKCKKFSKKNEKIRKILRKFHWGQSILKKLKNFLTYVQYTCLVYIRYLHDRTGFGKHLKKERLGA